MNLIRSYEKFCEEHGWEPDGVHFTALKQLETTYTRFQNSRRWYDRWFRKSAPPQGVYVWGSVGRGKTFLMDLFFDQVTLEKKARWHFTEFMQLVHQLLKDLSEPDTTEAQPIVRAADYLAKQYQLICLDEFQVTEIGDAMVLSRFFDQLIGQHVFVIVTSNKAPTDLYREGLHYDRFFSFVELIQSKWRILHLENEGDVDYRRRKDDVWTDSDLRSVYELQMTFQEIVHREGHESGNFLVYKRHIIFPHATPTALWVSFADLCERAYGAAEYHVIAQHYKTVFLVGVPRLNAQNRDATQRFILLIDCLYDQGVQLHMQSPYLPDELHVDKGPQALPFERTTSRLVQMLG